MNPSPVRIGALVPLSSPGWAEAGRHLLAGLDLAVREVNEAGGIGGRPLDLLVRDTAADPRKAVEAVDEFDRLGVAAVVGEYHSVVAREAAARADALGLPFLCSSAVLDALVEQPTERIARLAPAQSHGWRIYADFLRKAGHNRIAVATQPSVYWTSGTHLLRTHLTDRPDLGDPATGAPTSEIVREPATDAPTLETVVEPATGGPRSESVSPPATGGPSSETVSDLATGMPTSEAVREPATGAPTRETVRKPATDAPTPETVVEPATGVPTAETVVELDANALTPEGLCDELHGSGATVLLLLTGYPDPAVAIVRAVRRDPRLAGVMIGAPAGQPELPGWAAALGEDGAGVPFLRYLPERLGPLGVRVGATLRERLAEEPSFVAFEGYDTVTVLAEALRSHGTDRAAVAGAWADVEVEGTRGRITFSRVPGIGVRQWAWPPVQVADRDPAEPGRFRVLHTG